MEQGDGMGERPDGLLVGGALEPLVGVLADAGRRVLHVEALHHASTELRSSRPKWCIACGGTDLDREASFVVSLRRHPWRIPTAVALCASTLERAPRFFEAGAHGLVLLPYDCEDVLRQVDALDRVWRSWSRIMGSRSVCGSGLQAPVDLSLECAVERLAYLGSLSPLETEVAADLLLGASNEELAGRFGVAIRTAKLYVKRVVEKTGAGARTRLLRRLLEDCGEVPLAPGRPN